jgi:hypothetical protein
VIRLIAVAVFVLASAVVPAAASPAVSPPTLTWQAPTSPDRFRGDVSDVDCVQPQWCMVVDQSGQAVRFRNGSWDTPVQAEHARAFNGLLRVSCASTTLCFGVDGDGRVTRFDGSSWSKPAPVASGVTLEALSCPNTTFCMALGNRVARWDGARWHVSALPMTANRMQTTLSCTSAAFCMATFVRTSGASVAWKYAKGTWTYSAWLSHLNSESVSVSCSSRYFCMAVGDPIDYERWDGTTWHAAPIETVGTLEPASVSCNSRERCVMAGPSITASESEEWDGHAWGHLRTFEAAPPQEFAALSCSGVAMKCLALDGMGDATWYYDHAWNGNVRVDAGWGVLTGVSCGSTMCVVADTPGGFVKTSGSGWTRPARAFPGGNWRLHSTASISCT